MGTEHLLLGLLRERDGITAKVLSNLGVEIDKVRQTIESALARKERIIVHQQIVPTSRLNKAIEISFEEARRWSHNYVSTEHLLLGLLADGEGIAARVLEDMGATLDKVRVEIERVIQILSRRTKNNPALIGEAGVGKTAIAEGLARLITLGNVPESLMNKRVLTLDVGALVAGTKYRGEFEERLKKIVDEICRSKEVVLFMDELHTLVGAGAAKGAIDAATMLKPALARGEVQCIGATTLNEYRKYIEKDAALERRFQPVFVDQPTMLETIDILQGVKSLYEKHHRVTITDAAVRAAAVMSDRYVADRALPDKAIDLIDEGSARVRLKLTTTPDELKDLQKEIKKLQAEKEHANARLDYETAASVRDKEKKLKEDYAQKESAWRDKLGGTMPEVGEEDIAQIVAAWTGVPVSRLVEEETSRLLRMEEELHKRMVGQDEAIVTVSQAVRRARAGLKDPRRPIGSFIFLGPTGIGKTELARALAEYMFDSDVALIKLDMSEFMERHTTARLVGSPPGYVGYDEGGQLTEAVRRRPYSVILFDEIEKAHPQVFNLLLQILEDGRLSDAKGKVVNFANTVIIMTSNLGVRDLNQAQIGLGFEPSEVDETDEVERRHKNVKEKIEEELKRMFRPEFLNRVDAVVVFKSLTTQQIRQIVDLQLGRLQKHLTEQSIELDVTGAAKDLLAKEGYDRVFGARPLRRVITSRIEDQLSEHLLRGKIARGDTVVVDINPGGGFTLHAKPRRKETASEDSRPPEGAPA
jgi:ATP-dependent Clp protease ATP-binding subunit ClpC